MKCAKNPPHHETYLGTKFEVTTSNGLGGDTFTRNVTDRLRYEINIPFKSGYNYAENWLKYLLKYQSSGAYYCFWSEHACVCVRACKNINLRE